MNIEYIKKIICLDGKRAIVTGGSQGIGLGIAKSLANFGAEVTILARNEKYLIPAEKELQEINPTARAKRVDISKQSDVDAFFDEYFKEGGIDIFVNNAGISVFKDVCDTNEEEMDRLYATNVKGCVFCVNRAVEKMKENGGGNVVIITSVNAINPLPPQGVYSGTKSMLEGIMRCYAADLTKYGIRVNTLAPGAIKSNLSPDFTPEQQAETAKMIPMKRIGEPNDIGDVVACMVSDSFRYMSGSTVLVDGGLNLRLG